jgi:hypothetical protein
MYATGQEGKSFDEALHVRIFTFVGLEQET